MIKNVVLEPLAKSTLVTRGLILAASAMNATIQKKSFGLGVTVLIKECRHASVTEIQSFLWDTEFCRGVGGGCNTPGSFEDLVL